MTNRFACLMQAIIGSRGPYMIKCEQTVRKRRKTIVKDVKGGGYWTIANGTEAATFSQAIRMFPPAGVTSVKVHVS